MTREASSDGAASNDLEWRVYDALVSSGLVLTSNIAAPSLSPSIAPALPPAPALAHPTAMSLTPREPP